MWGEGERGCSSIYQCNSWVADDVADNVLLKLVKEVMIGVPSFYRGPGMEGPQLDTFSIIEEPRTTVSPNN